MHLQSKKQIDLSPFLVPFSDPSGVRSSVARKLGLPAAGKYRSLAKTTKATTSRDLDDLLKKGVFDYWRGEGEVLGMTLLGRDLSKLQFFYKKKKKFSDINILSKGRVA